MTDAFRAIVSDVIRSQSAANEKLAWQLTCADYILDYPCPEELLVEAIAKACIDPPKDHEHTVADELLSKIVQHDDVEAGRVLRCLVFAQAAEWIESAIRRGDEL